MATFSRSTFNAANYLQHRPSYPSWVWQLVTRWHATGTLDAAGLAAGAASNVAPPPRKAPLIEGVRWDRALDLGCGPGIGTIELLPYFASVVGVDPSESMINKAIRDPADPTLPAALQPKPLQPGSPEAEHTGTPQHSQLGTLEYIQDDAMTLQNYLSRFSSQCSAGSTEDIPDSAKADLIVACQAAHWLTPYSTLLPLLDRVLRPKGSIVLLGYSEFFLPDYPQLRPLISAYSGGSDVDDGSASDQQKQKNAEDGSSIGAYWEQPGRSIVDQGLTAVPFPWQTRAPSTAQGSSGSGLSAAHIRSSWPAERGERRVFSTSGLAAEHWLPQWASSSNAPSAAAAAAATAGRSIAEAGASQAEAALTLSKRVSWSALAGYLSTYSALHRYKAAVPDDAERYGGDGSQKLGIEQRFLARLQQGVQEVEKQRKGGDADVPEEVEIRWPLHVYAVKKM